MKNESYWGSKSDVLWTDFHSLMIVSRRWYENNATFLILYISSSALTLTLIMSGWYIRGKLVQILLTSGCFLGLHSLLHLPTQWSRIFFMYVWALSRGLWTIAACQSIRVYCFLYSHRFPLRLKRKYGESSKRSLFSQFF